MISPTANLRYNTTEPACTSRRVSRKDSAWWSGFHSRLFFLRFFQVGIQRIATLHFPFFAGDDADPAIDPFRWALAPSTCTPSSPTFTSRRLLTDKFAIAAYQIAILRRNGDLESDTLCG